MSWSYATGVLTSTGATEASPDSLLTGIAIVQTAALYLDLVRQQSCKRIGGLES